MSQVPYKALDEKSFWAPAVAQRNMFDIGGLWEPKFPIARPHGILTFGSCFAQHFGKALQGRSYNWLDCEPAPEGLSPTNAIKFNYGVFSARTGNIYTVSLLKQWVEWATGKAAIPSEVWEQENRFYDPFRPNIEPNGFESVDELQRSRALTLEALRNGIGKAAVFVFTLGLTESWFNRRHGYEYPMCPGAVAGEFDEGAHHFVNQRFEFVHKNLVDAINRIRGLNPKIRVLLTVSPVPLTATMSGKHVLVATMESKSILRAVAGQVADQFEFVDYFPSYEIINAPPFRGTFFESNQRSVNEVGVNHVMKTFFGAMRQKFGRNEETAERPLDRRAEALRRRALRQRLRPAGGPLRPGRAPVDRDSQNERQKSDVVCEEELLAAFADDRNDRT
jgi:hypothetical protein